MMNKLATLSLLAVMACTETSGYLAKNGLLVQPTSDISFDIPFRGLGADADFWCAAGEYVIRNLGGPTTRIYRTSPPPRRSGEGVSFSLSSVNATAPGVMVFGGDGGLTAEMARQFCARSRKIDFD